MTEQLAAALAQFRTAREGVSRAVESVDNIDHLRSVLGAYYPRHEAESLMLLRRIRKVNAQDVEALLMSGTLHHQLGDYVEAYANVERALAIDPMELRAHELRLLLSYDWDDRRAILRRITARFPGNTDANQKLTRLENMTPEQRQVLRPSWPPGQHPPDRPCR